MDVKTEFEQFYQRLAKLKGDSYKPSVASSNGQASNVNSTEESRHIVALRENFNFWLDIKQSSELLKTDSNEEHNTRLLEKIKLTLESLRDFIEHSGIYPEQERSKSDNYYQDLMEILKTPDNPQPISLEDDQLEGLFYSDLTHNRPYWDHKGEKHISIMNSLASFFEQLLVSHTDDNQKEGCRLALEIIFTKDKGEYNLCGGGLEDKINEGKRSLLARSPEKKIIQYWDYYKLSLLGESFGVEGKNIISRSINGHGVHLFPALDLLYGADKDLINKKDVFAVDEANKFDLETVAFLRDRLPHFHKFLYQRLSSDLEDSLEGFDKLDHPKKGKKINDIISTIVNSFYDEKDEELINDLKLKLYKTIDCVEFDEGKIIKECLLDDLSIRIPKILGVEKSSLKELQEKTLNKDEKNNLLIEKYSMHEFLKILESGNENEEQIDQSFLSVDDSGKRDLIINLTLHKLEQFGDFMRELNERNRMKVFLQIAFVVSSNRQNFDNFDRIIENSHLPKECLLTTLKFLARKFAKNNQEESLSIIIDKIVAVDQKRKNEFQLYFEIFNNCKIDLEDTTESLIELIVRKIPKNQRKKILKALVSGLSKGSFDRNNIKGYQMIVNELSKLSKISLDHAILDTSASAVQTLIDGYLKHHRSIKDKDLGQLIGTIYGLVELDTQTIESLMTVIDNNNDDTNKNLLHLLSKHPKWYNKRGLIKPLPAMAAGAVFGLVTSFIAALSSV
ncbi:hypothetical protein OAC51_09950, partial [Flavobacteriaceae bacterium]|nr:hypothetical protein [Flavobacteriaceae bacterium]